jgi:hypothetical protein
MSLMSLYRARLWTHPALARAQTPGAAGVTLRASALVLVASVASASCGNSAGDSLGSPDAARPEMDASSDARRLPKDGAPTLPDTGPRHDAEVDAHVDAAFSEATHMSLAVPDNGGPVLANPTLVTITFAGDAERSFAESLGAYVVTSPWLSAVGPEYGIGLGTQVNVELSETAPSTIDDSTIQGLIASLIQDGTAPSPPGGTIIPINAGSPFDAPDGGILFDGGVPDAEASEAGSGAAVLLPAVYMIYIPSTTTETVDGSILCDISGGGYHNQAQGSFNGFTFAYAVVSQCTGSSVSDLVQSVTHEFIEGSTDPAPITRPAWTITSPENIWSTFGGEVGDLCSFLSPQWSEGGYTGLQRVYSNAAAAAGGDPCLPAPSPAYFATDIEPQTWVAVLAGTTKTFPVLGWSTAAMAPWALSASPYISSPPTFNPTATLNASMLDNGQSATLTVDIPLDSASQSAALVGVVSAVSEDTYQYSLVGVYVE